MNWLNRSQTHSWIIGRNGEAGARWFGMKIHRLFTFQSNKRRPQRFTSETFYVKEEIGGVILYEYLVIFRVVVGHLKLKKLDCQLNLIVPRIDAVNFLSRFGLVRNVLFWSWRNASTNGKSGNEAQDEDETKNRIAKIRGIREWEFYQNFAVWIFRVVKMFFRCGSRVGRRNV